MNSSKRQQEANRPPKGGSSNIGQHPPFCNISSSLGAPCCTILESFSDGVFTIDLNKKAPPFNRPAELITGFKSGEAIGQYCLPRK